LTVTAPSLHEKSFAARVLTVPLADTQPLSSPRAPAMTAIVILNHTRMPVTYASCSGRARPHGHGAAGESALLERARPMVGSHDDARVDSGNTTTAQMLQKQLPKSRVVKTFSHIGAAEVLTDGAPQGSRDRRALALVGEDAEAKRAVAGIYDELGFDAIDAGGLA
jgi:hypothetical protein